MNIKLTFTLLPLVVGLLLPHASTANTIPKAQFVKMIEASQGSCANSKFLSCTNISKAACEEIESTITGKCIDALPDPIPHTLLIDENNPFTQCVAKVVQKHVKDPNILAQCETAAAK